MTRIKLCGLRRQSDIDAVNGLRPEYIGFVFAKKSRRAVDCEKAKELKERLDSGIQAVGVFVDEEPGQVARLLNEGVIDLAQLHGAEDGEYIRRLRALTDRPLIKAIRVKDPGDLAAAEECSADHVLLDAGAGDGVVFDWEWLKGFERPYFLAGGLDASNVRAAVEGLHPFAVDVSSGIETDGAKDPEKMREFMALVRGVSWRG